MAEPMTSPTGSCPGGEVSKSQESIFLPQFVDPTKGNVRLQLLLLGIILVVVSLPIDMGGGLLSGTFGNWLKARKGVQQTGKWITGTVFVSLGISTAVFAARKP